MNDTMTINDLLGTEERYATGTEVSDAELAMVYGGSGTVQGGVWDFVWSYAASKILDASIESLSRPATEAEKQNAVRVDRQVGSIGGA